MKLRYSSVKRTFDLVFAFLGLLVLAPVLIALWLIVRMNLGTPALFTQSRIGFGERPFTIYKFRTMTDSRDPSGNLLPDNMRMTPFGRFLRSTSLDELPQLWSVLKGDLSLVGPRPLLPEYLPRYSSRQGLRHSAMPGITGWAQVNGRNATTWEDRLERDAWYAENQSFALDLRILILTFYKVVSRNGINAAGEATMAPFRGNKTTES